MVQQESKDRGHAIIPCNLQRERTSAARGQPHHSPSHLPCAFRVPIRLPAPTVPSTTRAPRSPHACTHSIFPHTFNLPKLSTPRPQRNVYIYGNWLTDSGMEPLSHALQLLPNLQNLYLQANEIGSRGVKFLCEHPPVGKLAQVAERWVAAASAKTDCALPSLQLALWRNNIDDAGFYALAAAIKVRSEAHCSHEFSRRGVKVEHVVGKGRCMLMRAAQRGSQIARRCGLQLCRSISDPVDFTNLY